MDVKLMHNLMDALKVAGCSIGEDLIPVLYNSLIQLQCENHFESVYFWGRIVTLSNDYYIAYGHEANPIKNRIFFYSRDVLEWDIMPTDWPVAETELARRIKTRFSGDPRHVESVNKNRGGRETAPARPESNASFNEDEGTEEDVDQRENPIKLDDIISSVSEGAGEETLETDERMGESYIGGDVIKEENRLSISVNMIDNESHIVPRGFFYRLPDGNVVKAPYFKGLDYSEIGDQKNFLHINPRYVPPVKSEPDELRSNYNGSIDFLEPIDKDIPKGCWASRTVSNRYFIMHNLLWPGAVFLQDMNLGVHCFFYNGDGIKNLDLPFMI